MILFTLLLFDGLLTLVGFIFTLCGALFLGIPGLIMLQRSGNRRKKLVPQ